MKNIVILALLMAGLSACVSHQPEVTHEFVRTDGRDFTINAALAQQERIDATICTGEVNKAKASMPSTYSPSVFEEVNMEINQSQALDAVASGCMAEKGYLYVRSDEAAATRAEFAKTAGKRK